MSKPLELDLICWISTCDGYWTHARAVVGDKVFEAATYSGEPSKLTQAQLESEMRMLLTRLLLQIEEKGE